MSLSSIPGLYPLGASSTLPARDNQKYPQALPDVPWGAKISLLLPVEHHCFSILQTCSNQERKKNKDFYVYNRIQTSYSKAPFKEAEYVNA